MGFLFGKKQLLKVIEWTDNSKDTIVYKYPVEDRYAIMNSSTLVVRESQVALFMHKGQICDVFAPGTYKLSTENIPFLTRILACFGVNSFRIFCFSLEILFKSTTFNHLPIQRNNF